MVPIPPRDACALRNFGAFWNQYAGNRAGVHHGAPENLAGAYRATFFSTSRPCCPRPPHAGLLWNGNN
jgi:hypothetical protein